MADERRPDTAPAAEPRTKLPYSPPEITWVEVLQDRPHLMAACAQHVTQDDACNANPTS
jgi:hypothetical protein